MNTRQIGKTGENKFRQLAEGAGYTVYDVSANPDYWDKDIDFILENANGEQKTFEIKWDTCCWHTGNLFIETWNNHSKGEKGWFYFTQADYLEYGDAVNNCFYHIRLDCLREYIKTHLGELKTGCVCKKGDEAKGYLVPICDLQEQNIIERKIECF